MTDFEKACINRAIELLGDIFEAMGDTNGEFDNVLDCREVEWKYNNNMISLEEYEKYDEEELDECEPLGWDIVIEKMKGLIKE